jgi:hypothetical protein
VAVDPNKRLSRLLDDLQITEIDRPTYDSVAALAQPMVEQLASTLIGIPGEFTKHQRKLFDFALQVRPAAFHAHLSQLDRGRDPNADAYRDAPMANVLAFAQELADANDPLDEDRSFAARALLKSGKKEALSAFAEYARRACKGQSEDVEQLALECGYAFSVAGSDDPSPLWQTACAAVRDVESDPNRSSVSMGGPSPRDAHCKTCEAPLVRVYYVHRARMPWEREERNFAVDTCATCLQSNTEYYVRYDRRANPESLVVGKPKKAKKKIAELIPKRPCVLEEAPLQRATTSGGDASAFSRIGGHPTWRGPARALTCPDCQSKMTFVAQTDEVPGSEDSILLAFECSGCAVLATTLES